MMPIGVEHKMLRLKLNKIERVATYDADRR